MWDFDNQHLAYWGPEPGHGSPRASHCLGEGPPPASSTRSLRAAFPRLQQSRQERWERALPAQPCLSSALPLSPASDNQLSPEPQPLVHRAEFVCQDQVLELPGPACPGERGALQRDRWHLWSRRNRIPGSPPDIQTHCLSAPSLRAFPCPRPGDGPGRVTGQKAARGAVARQDPACSLTQAPCPMPLPRPPGRGAQTHSLRLCGGGGGSS